jgi:SAM-dependent methyltransferase
MVDDSQKGAFLGGEGDRWFARNAEKVAARAQEDPLITELTQACITPTRVLEIGCSNGWRVEAMRKVWACSASGIDPSVQAIQEGSARFPGVTLKAGTADALPFGDDAFDLVVVGFCLYLCDRGDLFRIGMEIDRALADGGHLAILDFFSSIPYRNRYQHLEGVYCYKMDYSKLFSWNPAYSLVRQTNLSHDGGNVNNVGRDNIIAISLFKKDELTAYVENPY